MEISVRRRLNLDLDNHRLRQAEDICDAVGPRFFKARFFNPKSKSRLSGISLQP